MHIPRGKEHLLLPMPVQDAILLSVRLVRQRSMARRSAAAAPPAATGVAISPWTRKAPAIVRAASASVRANTPPRCWCLWSAF